MKKLFFSLTVLLFSLNAFGQHDHSQHDHTSHNHSKTNNSSAEKIVAKDIQTTTFGVRGNCGMCKTTIETAVSKVEGIQFVNWDVDRKQIEVIFDGTKTNLDKIHQAIGNVGYDTEKVTGNQAAYDDLPGCCQYDRTMEMRLN